jgi:hypothetical protein
MWFEMGEDWAYHSIFEEKLQAVVEALDAVLKSSSENATFAVQFGSRFLVGERVLDKECKDPRAIRRRPFILRAALLNKRPTEDEMLSVRSELRRLRPAGPGESGSLTISIEQKVQITESQTDRVQQSPAPTSGTIREPPNSLAELDAADSPSNQLDSQIFLNRRCAEYSGALITGRNYLQYCAITGSLGVLLLLGFTLLEAWGQNSSDDRSVVSLLTTPIFLSSFATIVSLLALALIGFWKSRVKPPAITDMMKKRECAQDESSPRLP